MAALRTYWRWLGRRLRLSHPGRVVFTATLLALGTTMVFAWAHGAREGGAPLVVLALAAAIVIAVDALGRGGVAAVRRLRRHS